MSCTVAIIGQELDGLIVSWNPAAERLFGYPEHAILGRPAAILVPTELVDQAQQLDHATLERAIEPYETRRQRSDGRELHVLLAPSPVIDADGERLGIVTVARDISTQRRVEARWRYLAERDTLTGLYSRHRFEEDLRRTVARSARYGEQLAIVLIDLDGLKPVNDTHGHRAGDQLLRSAAHALARRTRASDLLARIGGDEFALILPNTTGEQARTLAENLVRSIRLCNPTVNGHTVPITASIGIATRKAASTPQQLYDNADKAMYVAKREGGDRAVLHQPTRALFKRR